MTKREAAPTIVHPDGGDDFEALMKELPAELLPEAAERSLWLNQVVAARIVQDPERAMDIARRNLDAMEADANLNNPWIRRWRIILRKGPGAAVTVLVSRHPEAVELRQNTPFAGVIDSHERARALRAFRRHWHRGHADAGRSVTPR
jgi:hypothetical protein